MTLWQPYFKHYASAVPLMSWEGGQVAGNFYRIRVTKRQKVSGGGGGVADASVLLLSSSSSSVLSRSWRLCKSNDGAVVVGLCFNGVALAGPPTAAAWQDPRPGDVRVQHASRGAVSARAGVSTVGPEGVSMQLATGFSVRVAAVSSSS